MINAHEVIPSCSHYDLCTTVLYTGSCSKVCRERFSSSKIAYWDHRGAHNDFLWVECSNCGFRVENYKAVVLDGSDTKFKDVKYKFCLICGREMRVRKK